jgi:cell wall-associated NlpC family hydrolase
MRTIGWLFILFAVWLTRAAFKGQVFDETGNFVLPQLIEDTLTAIITGDQSKLQELDAQTSDAGLLGPTPDEVPVQLLQGSSAFAADSNSTPGATGKRGAVVAAAQSLRGDKYSQTKRWANGFSDCSSFVGKALKKAGIKPPGISVVTSYRVSKDWKTIPKSQIQPGDIALTLSHMAIVLGPNSGIGQQRPGRNVVTGSFSNLFTGTVGKLTFKTYSGYANVSGPKSGGGGGGGGSSSF